MANGDAAAAAGMDVVPSSAPLGMGYDEINKSRDYIADRTSAVTPIAKGGTGATTAAQARTNLGVQAAVTAVAGASATASEGVLLQGGSGGRINVGDPTAGSNAANKSYVDSSTSGFSSQINSKVSKSGDTVTGGLYLPNASPATSGYTICYLNGDGRISKGASSRRYKKYIRIAGPQGDLFALPLMEFQMKGGDGAWVLGHIAEEFAATPELARFVVVNGDGEPEAIDYIQLLLAQLAQLAARVAELESAVSA